MGKHTLKHKNESERKITQINGIFDFNQYLKGVYGMLSKKACKKAITEGMKHKPRVHIGRSGLTPGVVHLLDLFRCH